MNDWVKDFWIMGSKGGKTSRGRLPVDDPEGISGQYDRQGNLITTGAITTSLTEVIDLISEGPIQGLVTGYWIYSGNMFETGYRTGTFSGYNIPPGTTNSRWMRSILWNNTPLVDSDNKFNFPNISISTTLGTENGETLGEFNGLTITKIYNERLRAAYYNPNGTNLAGDAANQDYAKIYRILNPSCVGIYLNVKFGTLQSRNVSEKEYGDTEATTVKYQIEYRGLFSDGGNDGWSTPYKESVYGKITYGYIKSTRINFNGNNIVGTNPQKIVSTTNKVDNINRKDFLGWEIRITRTTPDSTSSLVVDSSYIDSITEIYENRFSYPNSAMVRNTFNAEYFTQVPTRSYDVNLLKVKIPSNYDPILKSYSGEWDGTFATDKQWTDNPAWCFYDLITNNRYGLGKYIEEAAIDKWTLYKAGQYCDVLVPDGFNKLEPRFTCNTIVNSREDAFKVINDFASVFRSIAYYSIGALNVMQDARIDVNSEVFQIFTNANVEEGNFNYTTSPQSSRASVAIVRYNDKNNLFQPAIEYVEEIDAIKRYGVREREITAFGCTSRGQAIRYGKWALLTENRQYESISFSTSTEGALLTPGNVIKVYDRNRNFNKRLAGRARFISGNVIELDDNISRIIATGSLTGQVYKLSLTTPTYNYNLTGIITGSSLIPGINRSHIQSQNFTGIIATGLLSGYTRMTLPSSWDFTNYNQIKNPIWMIESTGNPAFIYQPEFWRVLNVEEEKNNKYNVFGIKYDDNKYNSIDSGLATVTYNYSSASPTCPTPGSLYISGQDINGQRIAHYFWQMPSLESVGGYRSDVVLNSFGSLEGFPKNSKTPNILSGSFEIKKEGSYTVKVWSLNNKESPDISQCFVSATTGIYDFYSKIDGIWCGALGWRTISGHLPAEYNGIDDPSSFVDKTNVDLQEKPTPYGEGENDRSYVDGVFRWKYADSKGFEADEGQKLFWRVSIRKPSASFQPDPLYYWQETGISLNVGAGDGYSFPFETNASIIPTLTAANSQTLNVPRGPYRNYDVVIEGHDKNGNSSAGGNVSNGAPNSSGLVDSTFSNGIGWDIMSVVNPPITGLFLWTGTHLGRATQSNYIDSFNSGVFHIDSYIENQVVVLKFITGKYNHPDLERLYVYFSGAPLDTRVIPFTTGNAFSGDVVPTFDYRTDGVNIDNIRESSTLFRTSATIPTDVWSGYLCISMADRFDTAREETEIGYSCRTGIEFSNVIPIFQRGSLVVGSVSNTATSGPLTGALPSNPAGFLNILVSTKDGISGYRKVPFFNK